MVRITDFFGLENLIHYHADISPKEDFFIQTLFFFRGEGRGKRVADCLLSAGSHFVYCFRPGPSCSKAD